MAPLAMERSKRANCDALDLQSVVRRLTLTKVFLRAALCVCSVLWAHLLFACPKKRLCVSLAFARAALGGPWGAVSHGGVGMGQTAGQRAMEHRAVAGGAEGTPAEPWRRGSGNALGLGADGVMVRFVQREATPEAKRLGTRSQWASWPAWAAIARTGEMVAQLHQRRLVASSGISRRSRGVCGSKPCVKASGARRRWSGSVMAGGCGAC